MSYSYANWMSSSSSDSTRLANLEAHISEVSAQMGADVSADGKSINRGSLIEYMKYLAEQHKIYQVRAGLEKNGPINRLVLRRPAESPGSAGYNPPPPPGYY